LLLARFGRSDLHPDAHDKVIIGYQRAFALVVGAVPVSPVLDASEAFTFGDRELEGYV
jgi:hypothetical protein